MAVSALAPCLLDAAELAVVPRAETILSCEELAVELRVSAGDGEAIGGYQVFLRYPAGAFRPLRFEPEPVLPGAFAAGPPPLGTGFGPCGGEEVLVDPWDDGRGEDVVAVAASRFPLAGDAAPPIEGRDVLVGVLYFAPQAEASPKSGYRFRLNEEPCAPYAIQTSLVFDASGSRLPASIAGEFAVKLADAGFRVLTLTCGRGAGGAVDLSWTVEGAPGPGVLGLRVLRDGEPLADLPVEASAYTDVQPPAGGEATYAVLPLLEGGRLGCGAECSISLVEFVRGDVTRDTRVNVTDAVGILRHLFQGEGLLCEDAADADDTGQVDITDAVYLLAFLFRSGPRPPPPFPDPGPDPTDDALGCGA